MIQTVLLGVACVYISITLYRASMKMFRGYEEIKRRDDTYDQ